MVESRQGAGTFVRAAAAAEVGLETRLRRAALLDVYEVRHALELQAARLAATRRDADDLASLQRTLDRRQAALAVAKDATFVEADLGFHQCIVDVALLTIGHTVDDLYQGAVPALLPFLVAERHYSYAAVSGLVLAGNLFSSIAQPAFGALTDRFHLWWLVGLGMSVAGIGVGLAGLSSSYQLTWLAIALSGLGVAAFHPEAARSARIASGGRQTAMSWFGFGGNIGLTIGPLLVTPVLLALGLRGTAVLAVPAVLVGATMLFLHPRLLPRAAAAAKRSAARAGRDDWPGFARLTAVIVTRAVLFFGLTSFLALYVTRQLGGSQTLGEAALAVFLGCGALGTLLGGHLADRFGRLPVLH